MMSEKGTARKPGWNKAGCIALRAKQTESSQLQRSSRTNEKKLADTLLVSSPHISSGKKGTDGDGSEVVQLKVILIDAPRGALENRSGNSC